MTRVPLWLQVLGLVLTAIGAITSFIYLFKGFKHLYSEWARRRANRLARPEYYYVYREAGYRVIDPGGRYLSVRRERIRALRDGVNGVHILYAWTGQGTVEESHAPAKYVKEELPPLPGKPFVRRFLKFDHPLEKGELSEDYEFVLDCTAEGSMPEPFLQVRFEHRVDELRMRVVFARGFFPGKVSFRQTYVSGEPVGSPEDLSVDVLTGEAFKRISNPVPHRNYLIEWQ